MILLGMCILDFCGQGGKLRAKEKVLAPTFTQYLGPQSQALYSEAWRTGVAEFFYSVDKLIPLLRLGVDIPKDSPNPIDGWVKYYFYVHGLIGYVLGALIAAWLSGLMKP